VILGDYRIEEIMPEGRGGMARVVRASFTRNPSKSVALKISRPSADGFFRQAIIEEVEVLKNLRGFTGIVQILPVSSFKGREEYMQRAMEISGGPWFFAMEYLQGGSLEAILEKIGVFPIPEAASLAAQIAHTLAYIHEKGYIHNDVKPDNILFRYPLEIGRQYSPVLIDFGIAAKAQKLQDAGSVHFMAPERLDETRGVIPPESVEEPTKADVWAVGVLLYKLLTNKLPFNGFSDKTVTTAIHKGTPTALDHLRKDIPAELNEYILESCMAKVPRYRPTIQELIEYLEQIGKNVPVSRLSTKGFRFPWQK
jgi:serine/threonine protein kinase